MTENASTQAEAAEDEGGVFVVRIGIGKYDTQNYIYVAWHVLLEDGYFLTRNAAQDHADAVEKERNAVSYGNYLRTTKAKLTEHAEKVRIREEQNRVLGEAGLPTLPKVSELMLFSTDRYLPEPMDYNEWHAREQSTRVYKAEVVRVEAHA